jgi:pyrroline-5-carboxylate reductase
MLEQTIVFLGAGNMAEALIKGLLRAGNAKPGSIIATGRRKERLETLERTYGVRTTQDNLAAVREADVVVLSVKPQALDKVLVQVATAVDPHKLIISVAAGVPIAAMERRLGAGARIIRTMPNTPSLV